MIQVCVDGKVWSAADARKLREEYRFVCGNGCVCRQNVNKAPVHRIPQQLSLEQVYLGVKLGFLAQSSPREESAAENKEDNAASTWLSWWSTAWEYVASFVRSADPEANANGSSKRRRIERDEEAESIEETTNEDAPLRCRVFQDLWEKGFYVTGGSKFGGDFLLYNGDPLTTHSSAIVVIAKSPIVLPTDLAGFCRLARSVQKSLVLAYVNDQKSVSYTTLVHAATTGRSDKVRRK